MTYLFNAKWVLIDVYQAVSTHQVLVLSVWYVEVGFGVTECLGRTKVNHIDLFTMLSNAYHKVIWLDVVNHNV